MMANSSTKKKTASGAKKSGVSGTKSKSASSGRKSTRAKQPEKPQWEDTVRLNGKPVGGALFCILAVCALISYFNTEGSFVAFFSDWLKGMLGWGFYLAAPSFIIAAVLLFTSREKPVAGRVIAAVLLPVFFASLAELLLSTGVKPGLTFREILESLFENGRVLESGGVIGGLLAYWLNQLLSIYGTLPILLVAFLYCLIVALWGSVRNLLYKISTVHDATAKLEKQQKKEKIRNQPAGEPVPAAKTKIIHGSRTGMYNVDIPLGEDDDALSLNGPGKAVKVTKAVRQKPKAKTTITTTKEPAVTELYSPSAFSPHQSAGMQTEQNAVLSTDKTKKPGKGKTQKTGQEQKNDNEKTDGAGSSMSDPAAGEYRFPPLSLLRASSSGIVDAADEVNLNQVRLEEALSSFGISAEVAGVIRGPTVTRYDVELDRGVKLARITNLAGDIALSLGVMNVRIAPIPDKISTVGIEVPNKVVNTVFLRDILESGQFVNARSRLSFALGKDIGGNCIVGDVSKLPHMLIAGTTGSGKSVCMNSLILSLLYKAKPDEVKLIMIDPKMVELGIYNGIPHLYVPVVTDPKKASGALQWSVVEMMKRYQAFSEAGVRDLDTYNRLQEKENAEKLPKVVIVIDELADLMLVASKEVEESICRVAQMGRAAGMHLVIATQRPSADVITGLMKANIPSRIAFAVSSAMESRIILDQSGAEKLIGFGDMLYSPLGSGKPTRIQGSYVSDEEREAVIRFIKENNCIQDIENSEITKYMQNATKEKGNPGNSGDGSCSDSDAPGNDYDEMLQQAADVVIEMGSCSVSMLQRRLKLGYSRAARIVDQMEELGIVGPYEGAKPRSIQIDKSTWHDLQVQLGYLPTDQNASVSVFPDDDLDSEGI